MTQTIFIKNLRIREFFLHANELARIRRKRREWEQRNWELLAISSPMLNNSHSCSENKFSNSLILDKKKNLMNYHELNMNFSLIILINFGINF